MASGNIKRSRTDRVAGFVLPPGQLARALDAVRRGDVLLRVGLCLAAALFLWLVTAGWAPPFAYRTGYIPPRDIVASVRFERIDRDAIEKRNRNKRRELLAIYEHDPQPIQQLQQALKDKVIKVVRAENFDKLEKQDWQEFYTPPSMTPAEMSDEVQRESFSRFQSAFANDPELIQLQSAVERAMQEIERNGLLETLQHDFDQGNQTAILVHPVGSPGNLHRAEVAEVRIIDVIPVLEQRLFTELRASPLPQDKIDVVGRLLFNWLKPRLTVTLRFKQQETREAADEAIAKLPPIMRTFEPGKDEIAPGQIPLTRDDVNLLRAEHDAKVASMSLWQKLAYSLAVLGMYVAVFTLCGVYMFHNHRAVLASLRRFSTMLGLFVVTIVLACIADDWRAEIIPLLLFGMTVAIAYRRELALLLSASVAIILTITAGYTLYEFLLYSAAVAAAILLTGRIRSRTKLIYIGAATGAVAMLTAIGVGMLAGQAFGASGATEVGPVSEVEGLLFRSMPSMLLAGAIWFGFCGILAGLLMTGLLPFIERLFDIQTDISLLELGDVAHPLLQELVRRAPGTYNHSINVASIADAAAESIGANGLLVRVGAYFHDIGKMLKPGYFVENQGSDQNRHESLMPAMSTLVIIAHVKDGADLARQHGLPQSIIDFIEQHHGTTLVEYFYRQAAKQSSATPGNSPVDESSFRYPGPKPQTKEAAVLMLADACESASRALVDPTPARLESLVHDIALKRLLDGQFEECGLSLQELHAIEDSLVKSLTAVYHGRVKYPTQATA